MNKFASTLIGIAGVGWYTSTYYYFYTVFFINVSLEPVIGPCRENLGLSACRVASWVFLWLMNLPVIVFLFLAFLLPLSLVVKFIPKVKVYVWYVLLGYVVSYLAVAFITYPEELNLVAWYTLSVVVTHSIIIAGSIWVASHLTRRAMNVFAGKHK